MTVVTVTNGAIIGDKIDDIVNSPLKQLNISLDAHHATLFKKMRGGSKETFVKIINNVKRLVEKRDRLNHNLELGISCLVTKENMRYMPNMIDFSEKLGVDYLLFQNVIPYRVSDLTMPEKCLYIDDVEAKNIVKISKTRKTKLRVVFPVFLERKITKRACMEPFYLMRVYPNGDAAPCCPLPTKMYNVVNVFENRNAWNSEPFQKIRKMIIDESIPLLNFCKTCESMSPYETTTL